ncbi:hypothetical protein W909_14300 [Dickeya zeae EC1]|nr:hypothetical protein W909_14300 [Dickeya zeae EC1]
MVFQAGNRCVVRPDMIKSDFSVIMFALLPPIAHLTPILPRFLSHSR